MVIANPDIDYEKERVDLRATYVASSPSIRLRVIRKRLAHQEIGPTKLVSVVSGVEALARSLAVHTKANTPAGIESTYNEFRNRNPDVLVEAVFKVFRKGSPTKYFSEDTWPLFLEAIAFRNLIVHECTYLGQDKYPSLIQAALEVLRALAVVGGLEEP